MSTTTSIVTELPEGITQADIDRYAKLDAGIKKLSAEHKVLNELLKLKLVKLGTFVFGKVIIKRSEASSFDKEKFEQDHPYSVKENRKYYVHALDASLIEPDLRKKYTTKTQRVSVETLAN